MAHELGELLFERYFEMHDSDGQISLIKLRIGSPQLRPETNHELRWYCPFQILGVGSENVHTVYGMDALDALLMSLKMARVRLKDYMRTENQKITWLGEKHLGLPYPEVSDEEQEGEGSQGFEGFKEIFEEFFRNIGKDKS